MLATLVLSALAFVPAVLAFRYQDYDNDLDPSYILSKKFNISTAVSQQSIIEWADFLAEQGPWCKSFRLLLQLTTISSQFFVSRHEQNDRTAQW